MNTLKINNTPSFQGARELFTKEMLENKLVRNTASEVFAPSELMAATENLLADLNLIGSQKLSKASETVIKKTLSQEAAKTYKISAENVNL